MAFQWEKTSLTNFTVIKFWRPFFQDQVQPISFWLDCFISFFLLFKQLKIFQGFLDRGRPRDGDWILKNLRLGLGFLDWIVSLLISQIDNKSTYFGCYDRLIISDFNHFI